MGIIMVNLFNGIDGERVGGLCTIVENWQNLPDLIGRNFGQSEEIITAEINSF